MTSTDSLITDPHLLSVLAAAARTRQQSLAILDLLEQHHSSDEPTLDDQLALSQQQKLLHTRLAQLRGLNRKAVLRVRETKHETAEARQEIDGLHLGLQNLYYEQRHLRGEIEGCEGYE
jgi:THO complex subunit 5